MLAYPSGLYQFVLATTAIHPQHIYVAYRFGKYFCMAQGCALFGTSVAYWYYPLTTSIRRTVDMYVAHSAVAYHCYISLLKTTNPLLCGSLVLSGAAMYPI